MSYEILLDPVWLRSGRIARATATTDSYFVDETESPAVDALERVLHELSPDTQEVVRLRVLALQSYGEIARWMGWYCGTPAYPNRKRAWRTVRAGLVQMRHVIETCDDLSFLTPGES